MSLCSGCRRSVTEGGRDAAGSVYCWRCVADDDIQVDQQWVSPTSPFRADSCSNGLRIEVLYRHEGRCYICGIEEWRYRKRLQMHRVIPATQGGQYTLDNVIPLCVPCHKKAEGKSIAEISTLRGEHR